MPPLPVTLSPFDYLLMARRRLGLIASVVLIALALGALLSLLLPRTYRAAAVILVESQQIPSHLLPDAVGGFAAEKVQVIAQRVMTRDNLLAIDARHGLGRSRGIHGADAAAAAVREAIAVAPVAGADARNATLAFEVAFEAEQPELAHAVANDLVTLFLSENARTRRLQAASATQFLSREAEKLEGELNRLDRKLAAYKQEYADALPEHLELRMGMLQRLEAEEKTVEREIGATQEELRFFGVELAAAQAGIGGDSRTVVDGVPTHGSLAALTSEYETLRAQYTDHYPDVIRLAEVLEERRARGHDAAATGEESLRVARVETQINSAEGRLQSLRSQQARLREEREALQQQIILTPQVQRELTNITRDYANARAKYEEVREKQIDASIRQTMIEQNLAEHFSLIEAPVVPTLPSSPDPRKLMVGAACAGLLIAGVLVFLLEGLDPRIEGPRAVERLLREPPLAIIPPLAIRPLPTAASASGPLLAAGGGRP